MPVFACTKSCAVDPQPMLAAHVMETRTGKRRRETMDHLRVTDALSIARAPVFDARQCFPARGDRRCG
jgi:hypothetical protein